jgi:hypothetical protein
MVFALADMVHVFLKGRRCYKVEVDILVCKSLQLRPQLVAELAGFLDLKLDLLLYVP